MAFINNIHILRYVLLQNLFLGLATILYAGAAQAQPIVATQDTAAKQTLRSGKNIYRVELRGLTKFEVLETGDPGEEGELHHIEVTLQSSDFQKDVNIKKGQAFTNDTTGSYGNEAFLEVNKGDYVRFGGRTTRRDENHDLWIHVRKSLNNYKSVINIIVKAAERDCSLKRKCSDGHTGAYVKSFDIPVFETPPPNTCGPDNMFKLVKRNNYLHLDGIDGDRQYFYAGDRGDTYLTKTRGPDKNGIILRPTNAWICIASTYKPKPPPPFVAEDAPSVRKLAYLRNRASDKCISLQHVNTRVTQQHRIDRCAYKRGQFLVNFQRWKIRPVPGNDGTIILQNTDASNSGANSKCLGIETDNPRAGELIKMVECSYDRKLRWRRHRLIVDNSFFGSNGNFLESVEHIVHNESGLCLAFLQAENPRAFTQNVTLDNCQRDSDPRLDWEFVDEEEAAFRHQNGY